MKAVLGRPYRSKGSAFVEMAVSIPLILLMCCGTMDFSRVVYAGIAMESAARAGVQYGALTPGHAGDLTGMRQAAIADASNQGLTGVTSSARVFCGCTGATAEISCSTGTCSGSTPSGYVEVTASYTFNTIVQLPGLPSSVAINRTARMRVQ